MSRARVLLIYTRVKIPLRSAWTNPLCRRDGNQIIGDFGLSYDGVTSSQSAFSIQVIDMASNDPAVTKNASYEAMSAKKFKQIFEGNSMGRTSWTCLARRRGRRRWDLPTRSSSVTRCWRKY